MKRFLLFLLSCAAMAATGVAAERAPATPMPPDQIIARMEQRFLKQVQELKSYQDERRYSVSHRLLGNSTYWRVEEDYASPGEKRFTVLERGGSGTVQKRVFARLLEVERETAREAVRSQVDLSRNNYDFTYLGFDEAAHAYKFQASPRGKNDYLLRGTIWVNADDFAVQRIEGEPATRHSILIQHVRFVHEFAKFGDLWFPVHHHSETELRLFGTATLEIVYSDYHWQENDARREAEQPLASAMHSTDSRREMREEKQ